MVGNDGRARMGGWRVRAAAVIGAITILSPAPAVLAQQGTTQAAPTRTFKAVAGGEALIRCAPGSYFYPIAKLREGSIVVSLGTTEEWTRVEYPSGTRAYVPVEQATLEDATIRLTAPSRLKAANLNYGLRGSWKVVLDEPLPAGTTFELVEAIEGEDGAVAAYLVAAPKGSVGYLPTSSLRDATPEEISEFKAAQLPETRPGEGARLARPGDVPGTPREERDVAAAPVERTPPPPDEQVAQTPPSTPEGAEPAPGDAGEVVSIDQSDRDPAAERQVGSIAALEAAFEAVYRQDELDAENDELIAEFRRAIAALDMSDPSAPTTKRRLEARIELLELRRDVQAEQRALAEATREIDARATRLNDELALLQRTHSYEIVGRLVPSTVYDGKRLPLMYRIQSVGQAVPRTLGYVRPTQEQSINAKVGEVVGVVGTASLDRSLKLRVVRPERIDVLMPSGTATAEVPEGDG